MRGVAGRGALTFRGHIVARTAESSGGAAPMVASSKIRSATSATTTSVFGWCCRAEGFTLCRHLSNVNTVPKMVYVGEAAGLGFNTIPIIVESGILGVFWQNIRPWTIRLPYLAKFAINKKDKEDLYNINPLFYS